METLVLCGLTDGIVRAPPISLEGRARRRPTKGGPWRTACFGQYPTHRRGCIYTLQLKATVVSGRRCQRASSSGWCPRGVSPRTRAVHCTALIEVGVARSTRWVNLLSLPNYLDQSVNIFFIVVCVRADAQTSVPTAEHDLCVQATLTQSIRGLIG